MMFLKGLSVAAVVLLQTVLGAVPVPLATSNTSTSNTTNPIIPNTYIVQLKNNPVLFKHDAATAHDAFHQAAQSFKYSTRRIFNDETIFTGLSLTLENGADLAALCAIDNVVGIWPVTMVERPSAAVKQMPHVESILKLRGAESVPVNGTNFTIPYITGNIDVNRPHVMSGVEKLHAAGIKGKGIKIAVIDTGVDFRHPALGGCFGPGCKISFGYDLAGDLGDSSFAGSPIPLATCITGGHGSHVMGIIGMEDQPDTGFGLVGVAPEATLGMYRVFGCLDSTATDTIIAAMIKAANDGADVISMSLGSNGPSDPFQQTVQALAQKNIAIFAAVGNAAFFGTFSPAAPAREDSVFAVGSVMNEKFPLTYELIDSNGVHMRYSSLTPFNISSLPVQILGLANGDNTTDGCFDADYVAAVSHLKKHRKSPSDVILAIKNGGDCDDYNKNAKANLYGYKGFLIYNTSPQDYALPDPELLYPAPEIFVGFENSKTIIAGYQKKPLGYNISFSDRNYVAESPATIGGGLMSNYSSYGPTVDFKLKPQLSAPGGNILSTWPLEEIGYGIISGTSMSTPFMAGCYALIKSQHPELTIDEIYALMVNTGKPMPWLYDSSILSSATHQGAGLVNAYDAVMSETLILPPHLNLRNDNFTVKVNITISNMSKGSKTYTLGHQEAGLIGAQSPQLYPLYAKTSFFPNVVVVPANSSANITIYFLPPQGIDLTAIPNPVYSGFIIATDELGMNYTVPYIGRPFAGIGG